MAKEKKEKKLRKGLCGFRKRDVLAYVDEIQARYETLLAEKTDEVSRLRGQNNALNEENAELYKKVENFEREQAVISKAVISAEQRAEQIIADANTRAEEIIQKTHEDLQKQRDEIHELKAQMRTLKLSSIATLRKYESQFDQLSKEDDEEDI